MTVPVAVAHPLIAPLPRLAPPASHALRWLALSRLRARWAAGPLDLILPSGQRTRIGPPGPAEACARIHDDRAFLRMVLRGEMGGGEAFVAGEWSRDDLVGMLRLVLRAMPVQNQLAGSSEALDDGADRLGLEIGTSNLPRSSRHDLLTFEKPGFYQSLNTLLIDAAHASCFV